MYMKESCIMMSSSWIEGLSRVGVYHEGFVKNALRTYVHSLLYMLTLHVLCMIDVLSKHRRDSVTIYVPLVLKKS